MSAVGLASVGPLGSESKVNGMGEALSRRGRWLSSGGGHEN